MQTKTIRITVSRSGINKAIRELEKYKKRLTIKLWELIDTMCMDGEDYACEYMTHVDTGETLGSIIGYRQGNIGIIEAGGAAIWIEFGTGLTHNSGTDHFHPNRKELGISDWGTYIDPDPRKNRSQRAHGGDSGGWYYYGLDDGKLHHTEGMPEEPFMANTAERLVDEFKKTAAKVFSK